MAQMRHPINLASTCFELKTVVDYLPQRYFFLSSTEKCRKLVDVGTVLFLPTQHVGKAINMEVLRGVCEGDGELALFNSPLFVAPDCWTTGEALVKIGAFGNLPSAHQAGWNKTMDFGLETHLIRISGIKCCIGLFRPASLEDFFEV